MRAAPAKTGALLFCGGLYPFRAMVKIIAAASVM